MKEIPILFSSAMVLALLDGRKTMTRRTKGLEEINESPDVYEYSQDDKIVVIGEDFKKKAIFNHSDPISINHRFKTVTCPYGYPGDLLWVRENFQPLGWTDPEDSEFIIKYEADGVEMRDYFDSPEREEKYINWIDSEIEKKNIQVDSNGRWPGNECPLKMRPAIHMFKEFSRIWLQVKSIRAERLKSISPQDAKAEGIEPILIHMQQKYGEADFSRQYKDYMNSKNWWTLPVNSFFSLWDSINGKGSVSANPWVWVVEFEVLSTTGRHQAMKKLEERSSIV